MARLHLLSLYVDAQEDWIGPDEAYLRVGDEVIWGPIEVRAGNSYGVNWVRNFEHDITIQLWEQDSGVWDDDDHIDSKTFYSWENAPVGSQRDFWGDGAHYVMAFTIEGSGVLPVGPSHNTQPGSEPPPPSTPPPLSPPEVVVVEESGTGRNLTFRDTRSGHIMSVQEFCDAIGAGEYARYQVRRRRGHIYPQSKPNWRKDDNLG